MHEAESWKHASSKTTKASKQQNHGNMQAAELWKQHTSNRTMPADTLRKHARSTTTEACEQQNHGLWQHRVPVAKMHCKSCCNKDTS